MSDQGQVGYDIITSVIGEAKSAKSKGRKYKWHKQFQPLAKSMQVSKTKTQSLQSAGPREPLIQCCLFSTYQSPRNTKLLGYKLLQFIANSSYSDVYKSSKKSVETPAVGVRPAVGGRPGARTANDSPNGDSVL